MIDIRIKAEAYASEFFDSGQRKAVVEGFLQGVSFAKCAFREVLEKYHSVQDVNNYMALFQKEMEKDPYEDIRKKIMNNGRG